MQQPAAPQYPAQSKGRRTGTIIAAVVVVVVVILALLFVFVVLQKSANVEVKVCSTHLLTDVTYTLYADGSVVKSGTLNQLDCVSHTLTVTWFNSDTKTVEYRAESSGGLFGTQSDSETVELAPNAYEYVVLYV